MNWIRRHGGVIIAALMMVGWALIVWRSGIGWNPSGVPWNFDNTAKLGDSFGVLSSIMAAIAAFFAYRTYQSARDDTARLEQRAAEQSYLNLLERRFDVLNRVNVTKESRTNSTGPVANEIYGQKALDHIVSEFRGLKRALDSGDKPYLLGDWDRVLRRHYFNVVRTTLGLPNLHRFTYHIISYADRQFSRISSSDPMTKDDPAYQYIRLLRAQLSDSELVLIALNCAFGAGYGKCKPLVERYALLHNMNPSHRKLFGFDTLFEPNAFGLTDEDRKPHGDGPPKS